MFEAPRGGPIRPHNFRRRVWKPAVEDSIGDPCPFHSLRHTHVAVLVAQGDHPKTIQGRLGHSSIKVTLDEYGHLFEGLDQDVADKLDAAWRESQTGD